MQQFTLKIMSVELRYWFQGQKEGNRYEIQEVEFYYCLIKLRKVKGEELRMSNKFLYYLMVMFFNKIRNIGGGLSFSVQMRIFV